MASKNNKKKSNTTNKKQKPSSSSNTNKKKNTAKQANTSNKKQTTAQKQNTNTVKSEQKSDLNTNKKQVVTPTPKTEPVVTPQPKKEQPISVPKDKETTTIQKSVVTEKAVPVKIPAKAEIPTNKKKAKKKHPILRFFGILCVILLLACLIGGFLAYRWYTGLIADAPELDLSKRDEYSQASVIYDYEGNKIAEYASNENIDWVDIEDVPDQLKNAFIAIEDIRFYSHPGIDYKRLVGAVIGQITGNANYGASTITQQLIKNTYLSREVTYKRKATEIHLALQLEKMLTKDEILEWYMNTLFLGDSNYGIKIAAQNYFGKELKDLSLRECAILAGLAQSPSIYNPRLNQQKGDMSSTNRRIKEVLLAMLNNELITKEEYDAAMADTLVINQSPERYELYDYPIYVEYAVENVAEELLIQNGETVTEDAINEMKQLIRHKGYQIYTALNTEIQDTTQTAIAEFNKYPATRDGNPVEASAVIMDQHTGEVVAMVGGREEPTEPEGFNRATDSTQAVGSSIKPISVYAPAIELGDYPGTTVMDTHDGIPGYGIDDGYPNGDYTNAAITMRRALELSHNVPAARFLLEHVTIDKSYQFMVEQGFAPEHLAKTAAGLALGATDVTTLEMTGAYATLANNGVYIKPHAFQVVYDRFGNEILSSEDVETHRVFKETTAWLTTDMMYSNMTSGLGVNARLSSVKSAGKTGTHEHQVISFGGYTPYYTSFVRISSDTYSQMINSSSYYQAAPLWKSYMEPIHEGLEDKDLLTVTAEDLGIKQYYVCTNTGKLAGAYCEGHMEYAALSNAPTETCDGVHNYASWDGEGSDYEWQQETGGWWVQDDGSWTNGSSWSDGSNIDWSNGWWDENGVFHPYY